MPLVLISHPDCALHEMGAMHPECPQRLAAINDALIASGLDFVLKRVEASPINPELLQLAHDKDYLQQLKKKSPKKGYVSLDADTVMNPHSYRAAMLAAGAGVQAADLIMQGEASKVFCMVRPPGHHAESDKAMGFCIFNNIALAALYLKTHYQLQRIAIVDFDVHHGNGTEQILAGRDGFLFCSTFQSPFYPFSGEEPLADNVINVPMKAGSDGSVFAEAVETHWLPALNQFKPQVILVSAGFDAHIEDDMAQLQFTEADYAWVTGQIKRVAEQFAEGRIISMLEGGYALAALGRSVVAHLKALMD